MSRQLNISVRDERRADVVENALEAAADELGADLDRSRGRTANGAVSTTEAIEEVAAAYTGWRPEEDQA